MQFSRRDIAGALLVFYAVAAGLGIGVWLLNLPESALILLVVPVLVAAVYFPRFVYILMALGALPISLFAMYHARDSGISSENYQTVVFLFLAVASVAEVIYQVVKRLRRAERRMSQSEARFRTLVENSPDGIIVLTDGEIRFLNPAGCRMLGVSSVGELEGVNGLDFIHPEDRERARKDSNRAVKGVEDNDPDEYRLLRRDGETLEIEAVGMPIEFEDEIGLQVVMRDVTDRNRILREKQVMESQMRQTQKLESLGVLAGGISHEFNNILVGIMGNAQLLLNGAPEGSPQRKHLKTIVDAAHRATGLCVQMRAYAGDDKGQSAIALDISKEVLHIEKLLGVIGIDAVELKLDLADNLPRVMMDPAQLQQILVTLVTNAAEAIGTKKGAITVRTGRYECGADYLNKGGINDELKPGTYVFLEIKDNGCGIPKEALGKIFDPFFTTKFAGRGLGLAAVVGMVRAAHGDIRVESVEGEGSTFTVLFPPSQGPLPDSIESYSYVPKVNLRGEGLVLMVDSDAAACRYGKQVLERAGFSALTTHDLLLGLELFEEHKGAVRVLLLNPTIGTRESVAQWRNICKNHSEIPLVLLGNAGEAELASCFITGRNMPFLKKPFKRQDMLLALEKAMNGKTSGIG